MTSRSNSTRENLGPDPRSQVRLGASERRRIRVYQLRTWWYRRGAWTHVFILAGLVCLFELTLAWAAFPWLLDRVSVNL